MLSRRYIPQAHLETFLRRIDDAIDSFDGRPGARVDGVLGAAEGAGRIGGFEFDDNVRTLAAGGGHAHDWGRVVDQDGRTDEFGFARKYCGTIQMRASALNVSTLTGKPSVAWTAGTAGLILGVSSGELAADTPTATPGSTATPTPLSDRRNFLPVVARAAGL